MSWRKGKTSGWAAFDRAQRHKKDGKLEAKSENFPSISDSMGQIPNILGSTSCSIGVLEKPFASVLHGPANNKASSSGVHYDMDKKTLQSGRPIKSENVSEHHGVADVMTVGDMLKEYHPWAEQSLVDDVLTGVNNDVDRASTLLNMMVTPSENNCVDISVTVSEEPKSACFESFSCEENKSLPGKSTDLSNLNCLMNGLQVDNKEFQNDEKISSKEMHEYLQCEDVPNFITYAPIEPEWEEDDVYMVHRKAALQMMRSASRHSKAASDAYLRRDHLSAQLHSQKAREEWIITERLNDKAAMEILAIRNCKNDQWTLDLHGLHASEAVQALRAHLQKIESPIMVKQNIYSSTVSKVPDYLLAIPSESARFSSSDRLSYHNPLIGSRPTSLLVITGKGNHSRGEAAIPAAIKSFLIDNGYRYDESRPGVIEVKPKFRRSTKDGCS